MSLYFREGMMAASQRICAIEGLGIPLSALYLESEWICISEA